MKEKKILDSAILCTVLCALCALLWAGGISTPFAEIKIENVAPGETYSLTGIANKPFTVKNTADIDLRLKVEVVIPEAGELKEGYQSFPDSAWVKIDKDTFDLKPGEEATTDVSFTMPKKSKYYGQKYQVYIWSHTVPEGGIAVAVGLKSRFLIHTAEKPKGFFKRIFGG